MIKFPAKTLIATAAAAIAVLASANAATAGPSMPVATAFAQDRLILDVEHRVNPGRKFNKHRRANRVHRRSHRRDHARHSRNRIQHYDVYTPWFDIVIGGGYGQDCERSYRNWQRTGSYYWRSRYYDCRY